MKTGTIKTLGAAALGAAFAAAAAGTASAVPATPALPSLPLAVGNLTKAAPEQVSKTENKIKSTPGTVKGALPNSRSLLGGLPSGQLPGTSVLGGV